MEYWENTRKMKNLDSKLYAHYSNIPSFQHSMLLPPAFLSFPPLISFGRFLGTDAQVEFFDIFVF